MGLEVAESEHKEIEETNIVKGKVETSTESPNCLTVPLMNGDQSKVNAPDVSASDVGTTRDITVNVQTTSRFHNEFPWQDDVLAYRNPFKNICFLVCFIFYVVGVALSIILIIIFL